MPGRQNRTSFFLYALVFVCVLRLSRFANVHVPLFLRCGRFTVVEYTQSAFEVRVFAFKKKDPRSRATAPRARAREMAAGSAFRAAVVVALVGVCVCSSFAWCTRGLAGRVNAQRSAPLHPSLCFRTNRDPRARSPRATHPGGGETTKRRELLKHSAATVLTLSSGVIAEKTPASPLPSGVPNTRKVETNTLGSGTDALDIKTIINGLWQVSGAHGRIDGKTAIEEMFQYEKAGLTTWDAADIYGPAELITREFRRQYKQRNGGKDPEIQVSFEVMFHLIYIISQGSY